MQYISHSVEDTQKFAKEQALKLTGEGNGQPLIIALEGELGAGKTVFTQAFAEALGVREHLKSPTFVLMKHYQIVNVPKYHTLYHLDCYRLNSSADLIPLGTRDTIHLPGTIILIEWAERVADILPRNHWVIHIDHLPERLDSSGRAGIAEQERNISVMKVD